MNLDDFPALVPNPNGKPGQWVWSDEMQNDLNLRRPAKLSDFCTRRTCSQNVLGAHRSHAKEISVVEWLFDATLDILPENSRLRIHQPEANYVCNSCYKPLIPKDVDYKFCNDCVKEHFVHQFSSQPFGELNRRERQQHLYVGYNEDHRYNATCLCYLCWNYRYEYKYDDLHNLDLYDTENEFVKELMGLPEDNPWDAFPIWDYRLRKPEHVNPEFTKKESICSECLLSKGHYYHTLYVNTNKFDEFNT